MQTEQLLPICYRQRSRIVAPLSVESREQGVVKVRQVQASLALLILLLALSFPGCSGGCDKEAYREYFRFTLERMGLDVEDPFYVDMVERLAEMECEARD